MKASKIFIFISILFFYSNASSIPESIRGYYKCRLIGIEKYLDGEESEIKNFEDDTSLPFDKALIIDKNKLTFLRFANVNTGEIISKTIFNYSGFNEMYKGDCGSYYFKPKLSAFRINQAWLNCLNVFSIMYSGTTEKFIDGIVKEVPEEKYMHYKCLKSQN